MWRNIEGHSSEVDLPVGVDARDDEEDARALGTPFEQTTQAEDDRSLVLLNNLRRDTAGQGTVGFTHQPFFKTPEGIRLMIRPGLSRVTQSNTSSDIFRESAGGWLS